jgi:hypothetical protein
MSALSLERLLEHLAAIEHKLVVERQQKQDLEKRLMSVMDKMDEVVGDGPRESRRRVPHVAKWMIEPSKPSEFNGDRTVPRDTPS